MSAAEEAKQRGNDLFKARKYRDAVQAYGEALSHDADNALLLLNRSAAYMALSDYKRALSDAERALQLQSPMPSSKAIIRTAKCRLGMGKTRQATDVLRPLLERRTGTEAEQAQANEVLEQIQTMERHLVTCEAYVREKNWLLASIALDQAQSVVHVTDATSPRDWQELRAMLLLQRGQISQAHSLAMDMYRLDPSDTDALLLSARVMLANNDVQKAITQAQAALRTDPDRLDAKQFLRKCKTLSSLKDEANAAFKFGQFDEALAKYAELLQVADADDGSDGEAKKFKAVIYSNRAILYSKRAQYADAISDCSKALKLDSGFVKPLRTRARAYQESEQYEEAVRDFRRALDASAGTADADSVRRELRQAELDLKRSKKIEYVASGSTHTATTSSLACRSTRPRPRSRKRSARYLSSTTPTRVATRSSLSYATRRMACSATRQSDAATTRASTTWTPLTLAAWEALAV